jgi:hypothetical protein
MILFGYIRNGQVVLPETSPLPEGAKVRVEVLAETSKSLSKKLLELAGTVEGPDDWAQNHDHYIHGTPKLLDP